MLNMIEQAVSEYLNVATLKLWGGRILFIFLILLLTKVALSLTSVLVERAFRLPGTSLNQKRAETLKAILKSIFRYAIYFIAIVTILDKLKVPITAVLSAAGILGLAVGFGAQNLVRDVITGFFILFEDQFSVGEYIQTEDVGGVVEEVGLRVTKLRDWGGELHIIPNGQITMVTNHNRGSMRALVEVGVAYEEDIDHVLHVLEEVASGIRKDYAELITEGPKVLGIWKFGESEVIIRIVTKTKPMEQWGIEMELRKRIKEAFEKEGIEIPYPRRVYLLPQKEGSPQNPVQEGEQ